MTDLVQSTKDNGIAVITINNPPVNALTPCVPEGVPEALDQIASEFHRQHGEICGPPRC
jgi:3-hydroxyacyl-CoA dehydrogenase